MVQGIRGDGRRYAIVGVGVELLRLANLDLRLKSSRNRPANVYEYEATAKGDPTPRAWLVFSDIGGGWGCGAV